MECWLMEEKINGVRSSPIPQYPITFLPCAKLMDGFNHGDNVIDRSVGQHAVAEVKDMAGTPCGTAQNVGHAAFDFFRRREQRDGIEIALHGNIVADRRPAFVEIDPPIE